MEIQKLRTAVGAAPLILAFLLGGCSSAQPKSAANLAATEDGKPDEARQVADVVLGKQAVILAQGDLARNGADQLLVADRYSAPSQSGTETPVFVTRAVVLEKTETKWSEIFRCDEHLKNPKGYLGGSPLERVSGWRLEFNQDPAKGLEMKFSSAADAAGKPSSRAGETTGRPVDVRWNPAAKRYQAFDTSRAKFLTEIPSLEAQPSQLK